MNFDKEASMEEYAKTMGCTACVVLITPDKIYCANSGDSRAVLKMGTEAVALSEDHKPENDLEF